MVNAAVVEGVVNFSNVTEHDVYNGQSTGAYTLTITMSEDDADVLADQGVKIKDYQGNKQRKFKSKYEIKRFDADGNAYIGEIPFNSRFAFSTNWVLPIPYTVSLRTLRKSRCWKRLR